MNDHDLLAFDECPSCSMALDSLSEEGLCYRCAIALHDVSLAIEAFTPDIGHVSFDDDVVSSYVM